MLLNSGLMYDVTLGVVQIFYYIAALMWRHVMCYDLKWKQLLIATRNSYLYLKYKCSVVIYFKQTTWARRKMNLFTASFFFSFCYVQPRAQHMLHMSSRLRCLSLQEVLTSWIRISTYTRMELYSCVATSHSDLSESAQQEDTPPIISYADFL